MLATLTGWKRDQTGRRTKRCATYFLALTTQAMPSSEQFIHGGPLLATSHRTFRERHDKHALAARRLFATGPRPAWRVVCGTSGMIQSCGAQEEVSTCKVAKDSVSKRWVADDRLTQSPSYKGVRRMGGARGSDRRLAERHRRPATSYIGMLKPSSRCNAAQGPLPLGSS